MAGSTRIQTDTERGEESRGEERMRYETQNRERAERSGAELERNLFIVQFIGTGFATKLELGSAGYFTGQRTAGQGRVKALWGVALLLNVFDWLRVEF